MIQDGSCLVEAMQAEQKEIVGRAASFTEVWQVGLKAG